MINAKDARKETLQMKESVFSDKIKHSIAQGSFFLSLERWDWERNWKPYFEEDLIKNGYGISEENGWVYVYWGATNEKSAEYYEYMKKSYYS